jgi:hypothetical protein
MKTKALFFASGLLAFVVVALLFTGCATGSRSDPKTIQVTRVIGVPVPGGENAVHFFIKRVDDHTYDITAFGDAIETDQQYLDAWIRMADELAAGRPYEKQTTIEPAHYQGGVMGGPVETGVGTIVKGRIVMK